MKKLIVTLLLGAGLAFAGLSATAQTTTEAPPAAAVAAPAAAAGFGTGFTHCVASGEPATTDKTAMLDARGGELVVAPNFDRGIPLASIALLAVIALIEPTRVPGGKKRRSRMPVISSKRPSGSRNRW